MNIIEQFASNISKFMNKKYNNSSLRNLDPIFDLPMCYGGFLSSLFIISFSISIHSLIFHTVLIFSTIIFTLLHFPSFERYYMIRFIKELARINGEMFAFFVLVSIPNILFHFLLGSILILDNILDVSHTFVFTLYIFFSGVPAIFVLALALFSIAMVPPFYIVSFIIGWIYEKFEECKKLHIQVSSILAPN